MTALSVGLVPFRIAKPSVKEPPTVTDLWWYGPQTCLDVLREEFAAHHAKHPQYAGWTENTQLGIVLQRMGIKYVQADKGDLVLIKRGRYRGWALSGLHSDDVAYCPRIGWNCSIAYAQIAEVTP